MFRPGLPAFLATLALPLALSTQSSAEPPQLHLLPPEAFLGTRYVARSTAIADVDGDGWQDIVTGQNLAVPGRATIWRNEGDRRFVGDLDLPLVDPVKAFPGGGTILGDYDNDGDLDIYIPIGAWMEEANSRNPLFRNDEGEFVEVGTPAGLLAEDPSDNAVWLDVDADGYLDIYTGSSACAENFGGLNPDRRNHLLRSRGDGTFEDITAARGLDLQLSRCGGSNGGVAALDFTGDGLVDLYVAVFGARNHLFVQQADGTFADIATGDLADPGEAFDLAVGDIDGDGLPDIMLAAGGSDTESNHSPLLLNLGGGSFVDVSAAVGLGRLAGANALGVGLGDLDNDGDLDLVFAEPPLIYLNDGHGVYTDVTEATGYPGDPKTYLTVSLGDLDGDGDLDIVSGGDSYLHVYRNAGNGNHFLRLALEGVRSNRLGIGARLVARSGDLRQTRWLLGGTGYSQDEPMAHFGLGEHTTIDSLYVYWPSGGVEILTGLAADQSLRLVEGSGHAVPRPPPTTWSGPDTVVVGSQAYWTVQPGLPDPAAAVATVRASLASPGGTVPVPVQARADGAFDVGPLPTVDVGVATLTFHARQATGRGPRWLQSGTSLWLVPDSDVVLYDDGLAAGWQVSASRASLAADGVARDGGSTLAFDAVAGSRTWTVTLRASAPASLFGYRAVRLLLRWTQDTAPADRTPSLSLTYKALPTELLSEGALHPGSADWQVVEVPLAAGESLTTTQLTLRGNVGGHFEIEDLRLVAIGGPPPPTAVVETQTETQTAVTPAAFALNPAYPNPFNPETTIAFNLPAPADVELAVFDLVGQRVATLVRGPRPAGRYAVRWDGRDDAGRTMASGFYLVRLAAGARVATRKVVMLR